MQQKPFVSSDLCTMTASATALSWSSPYKTVESEDKTFTIDVNGKQQALDRLKPAHIKDSFTINIIATDDPFLAP